ncbi:MAG: thioredoxin family protein [Gammaproteobacteria bacterium]|nr:thioredoxin family protein [Gammaproteobacteria bacterium]
MVQRPRKGFGGFSLLAAFVLSIFVICPSLSVAATSASTANTTVQLISEVESIQPGHEFWVALQMQIREGWHTYWRNPGDTGAATTLKWSLPDGFAATEVYWPYPERIPYEPLVNYGYHDQVALLVGITPPDTLSADRQTIGLKASWLVCADICVPEKAQFELTLLVRDATPSIDPRWKDVFAKARQALPQSTPWKAAFTTTADRLDLQLTPPDSATLPSPAHIEFFPFEEGVIEYAAPQTLSNDRDGLHLTIDRGSSRNRPLEHVRGVVVARAEQADSPPIAFEIDAPPQSTISAGSNDPAPNPEAVSGVNAMKNVSRSWIQQFVFAFLGGLILNLMPCVFPILSMKALNFVDKAHKAPWEVRRHGLAFTLGVSCSFAVIAGLLIALRYGGAQIGWGFQLQSPLFVTLLAYLMFAVGLSFSGAITLGDSLMNVGGGLAARKGYAGSFFTGALATVVATPCSAPFMGTALGFALTQPWPVALGIFQGLGLGLAMPYLLLSFFPTLFNFLPRPGPWMERFKEFLAFPMYGTAVWLLWVLTLQTGPQGIAAALTGLVLIAFAAWLYKNTRQSANPWRSVGRLGAIAALLLAVSLNVLPAAGHPDQNLAASPIRTHGDGPAWEPFSAERLTALRDAGQPVFLNFTAAWCITCLVNERVALSSPRLASAFSERGITYLKGDWTNQDKEISKALETFGRSGVPLYVYYPPGIRSEPVLLPQLLTESIVLEQLDGAPTGAVLGRAGD